MIRKGIVLAITMLVLMATVAMPVVTAQAEPSISNNAGSGSSGKCSTCTACGLNKSNIERAELKGIEKKSAIISALNLPEVQALKTASMENDIASTIDTANAMILEKKLEDGSIKKATSVILPAGVIDREAAVEISNIVIIWDAEKTRAMRYTNTVSKKDGSTEFRFTVIGENNKLIEARITKTKNADGTVNVIKDIPNEFTTTAESYWDCVVNCIIEECLCAVLGDICPPGTPSICDACAIICQPCYWVKTQITCAPCALCLGVDLAYCMWHCY
ncbi:MAG: hypothetical protein OIN66_13105 [Candidatus Methanoperedens sp.]|nr:hypothetical protein [Candidatus Methanoperedens sp.]